MDEKNQIEMDENEEIEQVAEVACPHCGKSLDIIVTATAEEEDLDEGDSDDEEIG